MGSGFYRGDEYTAHRMSTVRDCATRGIDYDTAPPDQLFTQRSVAPELDPRGIRVRESRDSADHPSSTPIIVGLDVTGSMSRVLAHMARDGMHQLMTAIYDREPVTDPHVMAMGIGDVECDRGPLQVTQFEADIRVQQQLEKLWLEEGGGSNMYESYALAWYFAARHTASDCFEKRAAKGFLFTVGDEEPTPALRRGHIERALGTGPQEAVLTGEALLREASERWEIFHVIVADGSYARSRGAGLRDRWAELLGQRAIWLTDYRRMPEVIVAAIQLARGADYDAVMASWENPAVTSALDRGIALGGVRR